MWTIFPKTSLTPQSLGIYLVHYLVHFTARYETMGCKFQIPVVFWRLYQTAFCSLTKIQLILFFITKNWNWQSLECWMEEKKSHLWQAKFLFKSKLKWFLFLFKDCDERWKVSGLWNHRVQILARGRKVRATSEWSYSSWCTHEDHLLYPRDLGRYHLYSADE